MKEPQFTIGVEEEYLLVDQTTRDLASEPPDEIMEKCEETLGNQVGPEFLRAQVEIGTRVCSNINEVREQIRYLRSTVAEIANQYGISPIASSTHPFALWSLQPHTNKERYNELAENLQHVVRRLIISGMHVHVGIEDDELRIDILNQAQYFLPHLLALSTSSPFWQGQNTGLKSYRLSIFDEIPRTGLPSMFTSHSEYERTISVLVEAGVIEDATKVWWDLRPSHRFPTLEMRISDLCTLFEDGICIAALYLCICRMLYRLRIQNQRWRTYPIFLLGENRWRAQRHGVKEGMIDFGKGEIVPFRELIEELMEILAEDADYFNCTTEIQHALTIIDRGTSADRQIAKFNQLMAEGQSQGDALRGVVDQLIEETLVGCG